MSVINIDIGKIKEIVNLGVRRATIFMGLGINAAYDQNLKRYQLDDITAIQFVDPNVNDHTISLYKEEFALWITANGFRELIETYSIFLDIIYDICLLVKLAKEKVFDYQKQKKQFSMKGIEKKCELLMHQFSIKVKYIEQISSINQARNCFVHRRGLLDENDCQNDIFELQWKALELYIERLDGSTTIVEMPITNNNVVMQGGEKLMYRLADRKLVFRKGEVVKLSPKNIAEICYFVYILTDEIIKEILMLLHGAGVVIENVGSPN